MSEHCWKSDYPIPRHAEHRAARRQFLQFLGLGGLTVALGTFAKKLFAHEADDTPAPIDVASTTKPLPHGYQLFRYPTDNDPAILVQLKNGDYRAYSQRCTHLQCPVFFESETEKLYCPCHEGWFNAKDGSVLSGPPPKPLPELKVELRGERIWVKIN
jgi:Rieske Fe-S protein|tara:strand:- start:3123 stop:3596 length:474 start_codon:yes stop_codon:yes gene_type:complete